jgi:hypothetical protein
VERRRGRRVSLKLLSTHLTGDSESVARFRREARAASGVSHRSVAHVYDFDEAEGRHYLAMEYVEGSSLREVLGHESPSVAEAVALASQVAAALAAAHWRGVVQRDAAFRLLGEEVAAPGVGLLSIRVDPMLDTLRDDPRFPTLEARYNFPPAPPK